MGRPHLLYTAWSFPPSRAGGVYRALATVNAFAAAGWDVTVLTVPRSVWVESTGADADLEERVAPGVEIIRVPTDVPAFQNDIALWPRGRGRHPELWKLQDLRRDMVLFPEPTTGAGARRSSEPRSRFTRRSRSTSPSVRRTRMSTSSRAGTCTAASACAT